ncbi:MAG TPA: 2-amino-4-hydroxy-6-hydroxymethyldihydropteridine diphosphokinase, partial [Candidatus Omnitrophota bacterium]|nr:2-amino-4-hydroxy-6-hydroxymethyldihydropteridine diphosphokinase [Candidatus Omnitrophota bacterium]HQL41856.1 2-amino-4-hydroxy-6-hydroxymethyldihydropteridine diphosphokinase [Candidatus Omnitrophota bacterium]
MAVVYLGLGSNLGDRLKNIQDALKFLSGVAMVERVSTIHETEPVGGPPQGKYLNAVAKITTSLSAHQLLKLTQTIEQRLGRIRTVKNAPRTIDIDILTYDNEHIDDDQLTIPHPRMLEREFVMKPLSELDEKVACQLMKDPA